MTEDKLAPGQDMKTAGADFREIWDVLIVVAVAVAVMIATFALTVELHAMFTAWSADGGTAALAAQAAPSGSRQGV